MGKELSKLIAAQNASREQLKNALGEYENKMIQKRKSYWVFGFLVFLFCVAIYLSADTIKEGIDPFLKEYSMHTQRQGLSDWIAIDAKLKQIGVAMVNVWDFIHWCWKPIEGILENLNIFLDPAYKFLWDQIKQGLSLLDPDEHILSFFEQLYRDAARRLAIWGREFRAIFSIENPLDGLFKDNILDGVFTGIGSVSRFPIPKIGDYVSTERVPAYMVVFNNLFPAIAGSAAIVTPIRREDFQEMSETWVSPDKQVKIFGDLRILNAQDFQVAGEEDFRRLSGIDLNDKGRKQGA